MSLAIVSPHLDDAAFSLAEHLHDRPGTTIICPFGGIPTDDAGRDKYTTLHCEHVMACARLNAKMVNGPFLDDVYHKTRDLSGLNDWLFWQMSTFSEVWIPLGIHHPDHKIVTASAFTLLDPRQSYSFYEELPYRTLYPEQVDRSIVLLSATLQGGPHHLEFKKQVCRTYKSQMGEDIERCLYVHERVWKVR